jgi:predicted phage terminase large subunit-like protein
MHSEAWTPSLSTTQTDVLDSVLRTDLVAFVQKTFDSVSPGGAFLPNWHIEAMCHELSKVMRGETKRLVITIPPRYLKSICTSVAVPAWALGHDPTRRIVCVSYAKELAVKHANDCRAIMRAPWYRRLFPATKINPSKNTETEFMTTERGFRMSTSVGGTLTGRGGNLIIIDDPLKPTDAMSEKARARHIEWCGNTLFSRLDDKEHDAIVLIMQRLHVGDLAGHLLQNGGWKHLNLPAIAEIDERIEIAPGQYHSRPIGDLLHPARESRAALDGLKTSMGSATFSAQYQQAPVPAGGNMIDWNWFQWCEPRTPKPFDQIVISWDTAMKSTQLSDYSVGTVWGVWCDFYYLLDVVRERLIYPDLHRKVVDLYHEWSNNQGIRPTLLIEDAGSGTSLMQQLRAEGIPTIPIRPEGDKAMRMSGVSAKIEAGAVYLPRGASWLDDLRTEVLAFPYGVHDDQVDSISQALGWMTHPKSTYAIVGV